MFRYSVAKELLKENEYFKGLSDSDINYILLMKVKNAVRRKRLQDYRHKRNQNKKNLERWYR